MSANREDIAKKAGVSPSTVSYVLNNSRKFSDETIKRVYDAVEKLNYKPHIVSRGSSNVKKNHVAITLDNIVNPYYAQIVTGFQDAALQSGYFVNICIGEHNTNNFLTSFSSHQLGGILILNLPDKYDVEKLYMLADSGVKIIMGGIDNLDVKRVSLLDNNYGQAMELAFEHLYSLGHRNIFYLNNLSGHEQYDDRAHSFLNCTKKYCPERADIADQFMITNTNCIHDNFQAGSILAKKLVEQQRNFSAVICTSDMMAISAIRFFQKIGLEVPRDVSVIGFDNIPFGSNFIPSISSAYHDAEKFGRTAFAILQNSILNNVNGFYKADVSLYKGCSTASPNIM